MTQLKSKLLLAILSTFVLASCSTLDDKKETKYQAFHATKATLDNLLIKIKNGRHTEDLAVIKALVDSISEVEIEVPTIPGAWPHHYVDPVEGKQLTTGKYLGNWKWEHISADGSKIYTADSHERGWIYDAVLVLTQVHHGYADALLALAFYHNINPDPKYLKKMEEILLAYATIYQSIPLHFKNIPPGATEMTYSPDASTGNGRIASQALGEAVWLCKVTQALDMVWGELDADVKSKTEEGLLRPAIDVIQTAALENKKKIHNIRCWYLASIGTSGLLMGDTALVNWSLYNDEYALVKQLDQGFTEDGLWYERSPSYHYYTITPMVYLINAVNNREVVDLRKKLKDIIMSHAKLAHPNTLEVPRYNDARPTFLDSYFDLYSYADFTFEDEQVSALFRKIQTKEIEEVDDKDLVDSKISKLINGMLFTEALSKNISSFEVKSEHYPKSGYTIFNQLNKNNGIFLTVKHDGFNNTTTESNLHQHHDQLSFTLFWNDDLVFSDPGIADYGAQIHYDWYRASLSHNTIIADEKNQGKAPSTVFQYVNKEQKVLVVGNDSLYEGVAFTRGFYILNDTALIVLDKLVSDSPHLYDIAMHPKGELTTDLKGFQPMDLSTSVGKSYTYLRNPIAKKGTSKFSLQTQVDQGKVFIDFQGNRPFEQVLANGYGADFEEAPTVITRSKSNDFCGVWLLQFGHQSSQMEVDFLKDSIQIKVNGKILNFDIGRNQFDD